ncbi:hypothetical protein OUZ56_004440 [Daphnia magna]|uniref:Uncharacterized protein n=1 Tax=Daphnia magna TaxID=35525 RepID=A0ABQ9YPS5_9CRUS|nr:hypothetical protein OUZ56_004440 [Daphnia magna]
MKLPLEWEEASVFLSNRKGQIYLNFELESVSSNIYNMSLCTFLQPLDLILKNALGKSAIDLVPSFFCFALKKTSDCG